MRTWVWILLAGGMMLGGCVKPEFTRQTYETICQGETQRDVLRTLGKPQDQQANCWTYVNEQPFCKAVIRFENGNVTSKAWTNERDVEPNAAATSPATRKGLGRKLK